MFLVLICYARLLALSCPKNFSAQSDLVLFCAPDNKNLKLKACALDHRLGELDTFNLQLKVTRVVSYLAMLEVPATW